MTKQEKLTYLTNAVDDIIISGEFYEEEVLEDLGSIEHMRDERFDQIYQIQEATGLPISDDPIRYDVDEWMLFEVFVSDIEYTRQPSEIAEDVYDTLAEESSDAQSFENLSDEEFDEFYHENDQGRQAVYEALWNEYNSNRFKYIIDAKIDKDDVIEYVKEEFPEWYAEVTSQQ